MKRPEVTTEQGKLSGSVATDFSGKKYLKFQGIPYAKPPLGELRFKAPLPPEKWSGILDATKEGSPCYAPHSIKKNIIEGSEDCLYLNVYTRTLLDKHLRPVLFWIHGGGFRTGSGSAEMYGPDFLITEEVVIVTTNYRLGFLGFLSLKDPSLGVPGNAGLKDIVMALKWVQKNIHNFGGDPNNVTICGGSTGGVAVHLLTLSPMSKDLFHKAIAQSGCAMSPWAQTRRGVEKIAPIMNLEGSSERTIYEHLMQLSVENIYNIQEKFAMIDVENGDRNIGFVIEDPLDDQSFLVEDPFDIILTNKFKSVPFMTGYTTGEIIPFFLYFDQKLSKTCENAVHWSFGFPRPSEDLQLAAKSVRKFYLNTEDLMGVDIWGKNIICGDSNFLFGIYQTVTNQFQLSKFPIYLYRISLETGLNFYKQIKSPSVPGCFHYDEISYLWKNFLTPKIRSGSIEDISIRRFVRMWANFAKYGNPTPDENDKLLNVTWKPVTSKDLDILEIGNDLVASKCPEIDRMMFWDKLYKESPAGRKTRPLISKI